MEFESEAFKPFFALRRLLALIQWLLVEDECFRAAFKLGSLACLDGMVYSGYRIFFSVSS